MEKCKTSREIRESEPETPRDSSSSTLRKIIGSTIQIAGAATLFGDAAYIFATHYSLDRHSLPYVLLAAGMALTFGGQIVKGFNHYNYD